VTTGAVGPLQTFRETPRAARLVLLGVFVNQFGAFLQAFLVLYLVHRGFSESEAGIALACYGAGAVFGLLLGGSLTDRIGPRSTLVLSMFSSAVLVVTVSRLSWLWLIIGVVFLAGLATQAYRPASATLLIGMTAPDRQVMTMAMNRIAMNVGAVAGPLVAAWLITVHWELIFWVDGATAVGYGLIALLLLPHGLATQDDDGTTGDGPVPKAGYLTVLRDRPYLLYMLAMLLNALIYVQAFAVLPLAIIGEGYRTVVYSSVFAVSAGTVVTLELIVTKWVQHWPARRAASLGLLLLGAGLAGWGVGLQAGIAVLLIATVIGVFGQIIGGPTLFAWPVMVAPPAAQGRYVGLGNGIFWVGQSLGPALGLLLWQQIGNSFWYVCGGIGLLSAAAAWIGMRQPSTRTGDLPVEDEMEPAAGPAIPAVGPEFEEADRSGTGGRHRR
jgi:predicted MFS family arabinose efflux permease